MKRLVPVFALGLVILTPGARADDAPVGCGLASAFLVGQDQNNVTIGCSGVTEVFGNQLADVLNKILQNRLDPQMVLAKLEEIEQVPEDGVARTVSDIQRQAIIQALVGKQAEQIGVTAHLAVDDSAPYAKDIATPLLMAGWQIDGRQIRRAAPRALEEVRGVAIIVPNKDAAPQKALQLRGALSAAHIVAPFVSDPGLPPDGTTLWIGRRPVFMQAEAAKQ